MSFLSDQVIDHLAAVAQEPDLSGTRYRLLGPLGAGGMGEVYAAEDTVLGREVAIKVTAGATERLRREAMVIAGLEHPGIVPVHDMGTLPDGSTYYVMKRVRGERLDHWIATRPPLPEVLRLFQRVCEAVAFAHGHGVIHRDLKPQNVMIGSFGEALVMDWGLAKPLGAGEDESASAIAHTAPGATVTGAVMGTPAYMSPEQARGETGELDRTADVYSLGAILYFLLSGRPPFDAPTSREVIDSVLSRQPTALEAPKPLVSILRAGDGEGPPGALRIRKGAGGGRRSVPGWTAARVPPRDGVGAHGPLRRTEQGAAVVARGVPRRATGAAHVRAVTRLLTSRRPPAAATGRRRTWPGARSRSSDRSSSSTPPSGT